MHKPDIEFPGVQIWDNLLDDRFLLDLDEESNYYNWNLSNIANRKSYPYGIKGSHLLWGVTLYTEKNPKLSHNSDNIKGLFSYITNNVIGSNFNLKTIQMNGQSIGQNGTCHTDNQPNAQEYTLMVYINHKWEEKWGGDFQILKEHNDNSEIIHSIKYVPGRIILFDGSTPHRGLAPLEPYVVRKSLVFRLKKYKL
jgi:hypothetical protein